MDTKQEKELPEYVLDLLKQSADGTGTAEVIAVFRGKNGYTYTTWGRQTAEWVNERNAGMGIDLATKLAYSTCSHTGGWNRLEEIIAKMRERVSSLQNEFDKIVGNDAP